MSGHGSVTPVGGRCCGACTACCTHLPIPAGVVSPAAKPAGILCPSASTGGCRVYSKRPQMCADFHCAWLSDAAWCEAWRPDRCGLLCLRADIGENVPAAALYEIRPLALKQPVAAEILAELQSTTIVVAVVDSEQRRHRLPGYWVSEGDSLIFAARKSGQSPSETSVAPKPSSRDVAKQRRAA